MWNNYKHVLYQLLMIIIGSSKVLVIYDYTDQLPLLCNYFCETDGTNTRQSKLYYRVELHKKWSFPLRISSVIMTKSAGNNVQYFKCLASIPNSFLLRISVMELISTIFFSLPQCSMRNYFLLKYSHKTVSIGLSRTLSNVYDDVFLQKIVKCV